MKTFTCLFLSVLFFQTSLAQGYDIGTNYDTLGFEQRKEWGKQAITDLKDGVLVVRLQTGSSKIAALDRLIGSSSLTDAERQRFEGQKKNHLEDLRKQNEMLVTAFQAKYNFSQLLFVPDTSVQHLKNGERSSLFYGGNLEIDPSISLDGDNFFVVYHGLSSSSRTSGVQGIVVQNNELVELVEPFPFFTGMTTVKKKLASFFRKVDEQELFFRLVEKFNGRLLRFHNEVTRGY